MKILVLGSIHIDYNYYVGHITTPKETQASVRMETFPGGKGLNQAVALVRAGMKVQLAGMVGEDGVSVVEEARKAGVDTSLVRTIEARTGHAIIQVDEIGQNAILLYNGANDLVDEAYIDEILEDYGENDVLVLQNEIANLGYTIERAHEKGMYIVLNPSPCTEDLMKCDLTKVSMLCINEVEGRELTSFVQPGDILIKLEEMFPDSEIIFTLGAQGSFYKKGSYQCYQASTKVAVVDTTAAGDVFEGYFLASYLNGKEPKEALRNAAYAAGIAVTREGAAFYCAPTREELLAFSEK